MFNLFGIYSGEALSLLGVATWLIFWATTGVLFLVPTVREFLPYLGYSTATLNLAAILSWAIFALSIVALIVAYKTKPIETLKQKFIHP